MQVDVFTDIGPGLLKLDELTVAAATIEVTAWPEITADVHRMERERFNVQGPGWAPLSDTTLNIRAKRGSHSTKILIDHGTLVGSLTSSGAEGSVVDTRPDELFVGTNLHYAQYHQTGPRQIRVFGRGSATLPERKLVEVTEYDALRWGAIVQRTLLGIPR